MVEAPERIRVAQDAEGFWTCREAISGSQEYTRSDIAERQIAELRAELATVKLAQEANHNLAVANGERAREEYNRAEAAEARVARLSEEIRTVSEIRPAPLPMEAAIQADKIPDEIMQEAERLAYNCHPTEIARALMARDKRAAEIAHAFADSEEINSLSGTAATNEVGDPGWIKDALHSQGQEIAEQIATVILTYGGPGMSEGKKEEERKREIERMDSSGLIRLIFSGLSRKEAYRFDQFWAEAELNRRLPSGEDVAQGEKTDE